MLKVVTYKLFTGRNNHLQKYRKVLPSIIQPQLNQSGPSRVNHQSIPLLFLYEENVLYLEQHGSFPRPSSPHISVSSLLFSHSGVNVISCDMRKHVLCLSGLCKSSADSPLLTPLLPQKSLSPTSLSPLPHICCAYEHQNAIRPSKTPLVPWLAGASHRGCALWALPAPNIAHHWASAPAVVKNKPQKEPFLRRNIGTWKTDRTTGADNTRQNTITLHPVTVGHCNCLRQRRDGGGSGCGRGGGRGGTAGANGVMSYGRPEWQLVNWGGLADQIKCINSRKWISRAVSVMAISNEAKCKWGRKRVVKTFKLTIKGWWSVGQWPSISPLITFMWN